MRISKGFSVIEVIVGAAIVAIVVTAIASAWQFYGRVAGQSVRGSQADLLLEEGAEALQYMRDKGWTANIASLALNTAYYMTWNGSTYTFSVTPTATNGGYARTVKLTAVYRDASDNIAASGTLDPNTLLATITVYPSLNSSTNASTTILQAQTLIHNVFNN